MSKILTEMPKKAGGQGRKAIYPYAEWLDGQIRQLEPGIDYTAKPQSVVASIRQTAENRGLKLRSRFTHDTTGKVDGIVIQAYEPEVAEPEEVEQPQTIKKSTRRARTKAAA
jgi:hypothetical protein